MNWHRRFCFYPFQHQPFLFAEDRTGDPSPANAKTASEKPPGG
jgi:hypothetical protein